MIDHLEVKGPFSLEKPQPGKENEFLKCHNDDKYDFDVINSTTIAQFSCEVTSSLGRPPTHVANSTKSDRTERSPP